MSKPAKGISLLDQMTAPAPELPPTPATAEDARMKAAMVFQTHAFLGRSIETAQAEYSKLLDTTPQQLEGVLGNLIAAADGIKTKAQRLLASNR